MREYEYTLCNLKTENDQLKKEALEMQKQMDKLQNKNNKLVYELHGLKNKLVYELHGLKNKYLRQMTHEEQVICMRVYGYDDTANSAEQRFGAVDATEMISQFN